MTRAAVSALVGLVAIAVIAGAALMMAQTDQRESILASTPTPAAETAEPAATSVIPNPAAVPPTTTLRAASITNVSSEFTFVATIPTHWQAEAVPATAAINLYDPAAVGENNLEKSQIFMRTFSANSFLTLPTVTIHDRAERIINGRPAMRYTIEKKALLPNFPNQPAWRSARHIVTDIRVSDTNPSVFYVIAKRPDLAQETYENFLQTLQVIDTPNDSLVLPVDEFHERITKKPFGIYITPANSPVQPERFTGYHTGADIEYGDIAGDVPVRAIAEGRVVAARTAGGYGGVAALEHAIAGADRLVIYGHLDPKSLPTIGQRVTAGEQIGVLGEGGTSATDGERKHLHFAVLKSTRLDLRGYVLREADLINWLNPLELFK